MKKTLWMASFCFSLLSCQQQSNKLYETDKFAVYKDSVVQGNNKAQVESPIHLVSNYQSLVHENYSRLITFKFSINEKDNEKISGADHWIIIGDEGQSSVIEFGSDDPSRPADPGTKLPPNYPYTFRVDMNPVFKQFDEKGYFEAFDGSRVAKDDFKAVYIAGGSDPLSWDFSNLEENRLALKDEDGDGIFELTVVLNPFNFKDSENKVWKLSTDISAKPSYKSEQPLVDALFNLSLEEAIMNIEADSTLRTGAKWGGVWTRDVSYSILLAFAYHEPEVAKISLMKKVKRNRIIQDTGSGGAWPVSSDRTTWALGAWEVYKVTGDQEFLKTAYTIIKNTLDDDYKTIRDAQTGMYRGESSFLDWREQTYPKWMSNMDIYSSQNLGTNVVHYQAHQILVEMAKLLGEPYEAYQNRAEDIKKGVNKYLWMDNKGYYAQYLYGRSALVASPRFEALGEALSILFEVADESKAKSIISKSPLTTFGTTCIYPQIPEIPPYHNNGIWPFVQSYWNLAAAKTGNEAALLHGLASIYRAGGLFLTNYENFVAQNGDYVGTEINSHRMLWSMAGNLAMVHRVFMGISFDINGIQFSPAIPKAYGGKRTLTNFAYRNANFDITVMGYGNQIAKFILDGQVQENAFVPSAVKGKHTIEITMANNAFDQEKINLVPNRFSLPNPITKLNENVISWVPIQGAVSYNIYKDGQVLKNLSETNFTVERNRFAEYSVSALDSLGTESFISEPINVYNTEQVIEIEDIYPASNLAYTNYFGSGFIKLSATENTKISIPVSAKQEGIYLIDCRYSNGTGPLNTDNNCAIRSFYANGNYEGVWVMPQRGSDEWSDWGYSNAIEVKLNKGTNTLELAFEDWNINMDGEINEALIDRIRIIKM